MTTTTRTSWLRRAPLFQAHLLGETTPPPPRWPRLLLLALLLGLLAFCHGCHGGDHDDELFSRHWRPMLRSH